MKKRLLIAAGVTVALVLLVVVGAGLAAGMYVRQGIERGATYALGVPTTVGSANLGLLGGRLALTNVTVTNPQGFSTPHLIRLGEGGVAVTLRSLLKDTIHVPKFSLSDLDVNLERHEGKANYQVVMENLEKVTGPAPQDPKKLVIDELTITGVMVHVDLRGIAGAGGAGGAVGTAVGDAVGGAVGGALGRTTIDVPIAEIKLTDVGSTGSTGGGVGGTGVTIAELTSIIVEAVMAAVVENGGDRIPAEILGDLRDHLKDLDGLSKVGVQVGGQVLDKVLGKDLEKAGQEIQDQVQTEAEKAAEKAKKDLEQGLGDILGGSKKKGGG